MSSAKAIEPPGQARWRNLVVRLRARTQTSSKRQNFVEVGGNFDFVVSEVAQPGAIRLDGVEEDSHNLFQSDPLHFGSLSHSVIRIEQFQFRFGAGGSHVVVFHEQGGVCGGADLPDRCSQNRSADRSDLRISVDGAKFFARVTTTSIKVHWRSEFDSSRKCCLIGRTCRSTRSTLPQAFVTFPPDSPRLPGRFLRFRSAAVRLSGRSQNRVEFPDGPQHGRAAVN